MSLESLRVFGSETQPRSSEEKRIPFQVDPVDFSLSTSELSTLSCPSVVSDFKIIIDGSSYQSTKNLCRTVFSEINAALVANPNLDTYTIADLRDPHFHFQLIQNLLSGDTITINEGNALFLHSIGDILGNPSLSSACSQFLSRYTDGELKKPSFLAVFWSSFSVLLKSLGWIMRIVLFLSELIGLAVFMSFSFNFLMVPITSGIISPEMSTFFIIALMIPFFLFNMNCINLISLLCFNIAPHNSLSDAFPFVQIYTLAALIKKCFPFFRAPVERKFDSLISNDSESEPPAPQMPKKPNSELADIILGGIFLLLFVTFFFRSVFRYFVIVVTVYIPVFFYTLLILLYSLHAYLAISPHARQLFIQNGDFSDPFLCSMYFSPNLIPDAIRSIYLFINGRWNSEDKSIVKIVLNAFFSKSSAAIYILIVLSVFLIDQRAHFNALQVFLIILIISIILIPLLSSINFEYFIIRRLFTDKKSEHELIEMRKWMHSDSQRQAYLTSTLSWGRSTLAIRFARICFSIFFIICILLAIYPSVLSPTQYVSASSDSLYEEFNASELMNPVCHISVGGLTIDQYAILAYAVYEENDSSEYHAAVLEEYFGENWSSIISVHHDVPFMKSEYNGFIRHYSVQMPNSSIFHIIAIRGTSNSLDIMSDIELWASSLMMNLLKSSIPIFSLYQEDTREFLGYAMHLPRYMFKDFSLINSYVTFIDNYVSNLTVGNNVVLVGHSLGGGLAKLISAQTGYQAISFSGPGITAISAFYHWKDVNMAHSFLNVVPKKDPVAGVDMASGSDFYIPCTSPMLNCHSMIRTTCQLSTMCGRYHKHYDFCKRHFDNSESEMENFWKIGHPYVAS